jgi:tetratricopeptide (TPR) repeat protein
MPADDPSNLNPEQDETANEAAAAREEEVRSAALTTEQRRLLGGPRSLRGRLRQKAGEPASAAQPEVAETAAVPAPAESKPIAETQPETAAPSKAKSPVAITPRISPRRERSQPSVEAPAPAETETGEEQKKGGRPGGLVPDKKSGRAVEMQRAALIIGGLILVALTFYVGKKFEYWKYLLTTARNKPKLEEAVSGKYANLSAQQLVEQALTAEREHRWKDAVDRFVAAKEKDLRYRGILFRLGRLALNAGDAVAADKWFERSIQFGENVDAANYFRGLIAVRREDFASAERFFEAAAGTEPFIPYYQFYWGEALRMERHPKEAIPHYEIARNVSDSPAEHAVYDFKIRMARLEAGQVQQIRAELESAGENGALPLDWLMTKAALAVRDGRTGEAINLLREAHADSHANVFASCASDNFFVQAGKQNNEIAELCKVEGQGLAPHP